MRRHGDLRRAFRTARTVPAAGSTAPLSAPPLSRGLRGRRLRKLKIAKAAVRVYSILLSLATVFAADAAFNDLTVITSVGMAVFNLCSLFYNLFGSPRRYPATRTATTAEPDAPLLPLGSEKAACEETGGEETSSTSAASRRKQTNTRGQTKQTIPSDFEDAEERGGACASPLFSVCF